MTKGGSLMDSFLPRMRIPRSIASTSARLARRQSFRFIAIRDGMIQTYYAADPPVLAGSSHESWAACRGALSNESGSHP